MSFTLHRGALHDWAYGIVRRNGVDICTASWNRDKMRWERIEFVDAECLRSNRTRQAAARLLASVEGKEWTPDPVAV
jgi:hypothetical protein